MNDNDKKTNIAGTPRTGGDSNPDPITGAPGAHPIGTGIGAAGGGAAGAAIGAIGGPVGVVAGAAIGAVVGGLAGKGAAEAIDPTVEDAYWRSNYATRPYVDKAVKYDDYSPAYTLGRESALRNPGRKFDDLSNDLGRDWDKVKGASALTWDKAKDATRDAWKRTSDTVERLTPGDSDHDGK